jgi:threonine dehydrogenase-like Zn-dependent dehydrogenase
MGAGRVVIIGACTEDDGFAPITAMSKELDLRFRLHGTAEVEMAIAAFATGRVATGPMITHTMGIDDLLASRRSRSDRSKQGDGRVLAPVGFRISTFLRYCAGL